jgi:hypothetical protein
MMGPEIFCSTVSMPLPTVEPIAVPMPGAMAVPMMLPRVEALSTPRAGFRPVEGFLCLLPNFLDGLAVFLDRLIGFLELRGVLGDVSDHLCPVLESRNGFCGGHRLFRRRDCLRNTLLIEAEQLRV